MRAGRWGRDMLISRIFGTYFSLLHFLLAYFFIHLSPFFV